MSSHDVFLILVCTTLSISMSLLVCSYFYGFENPFTSMVLILCENRIRLITQSFHIPLIVTNDLCEYYKVFILRKYITPMLEGVHIQE